MLTTEDQTGLPNIAYIIHTPMSVYVKQKVQKTVFSYPHYLCMVHIIAYSILFSIFKTSCNPPKWFQDPVVRQDLSIRKSLLYPKTTNQTEHKSAALT